MIEFAIAAGFAALVAIPVILIVFSLRPRRRTVVVSSNALWQAALREQRQGLGLRNLLRNLSLLLCLIAATALALSLAGPQWLTLTKEPGDLILIVDTSASMKVRDGGSTRFERAVARARELVRDLPVDHRALIVASGNQAELRSGFESEGHNLIKVLDELEPTDARGHPQQAVELALSLLQSRDDGRVVFITDGAFDARLEAAGARFELELIAGEEAPPVNFAITRFDVRPQLGRPGYFEALITVRSYASDTSTLDVSLEIEGRELVRERVQLQPDASTTEFIAFRGPTRGRAVARLLLEDALSVDNVAQATYGGHGPLNVLLAGPANVYLESLFAAMPQVLLTRSELLRPDELAGAARRNDLVVMDRQAVTELPPGRFLVFGALPGGLPVQSKGELSPAQIAGTGNAAFIEGLDFRGVTIERALRLEVDPDAVGVQRLLWSEEGDLAVATLDEQRRVVTFGFALGDSNLPSQALFPLLISSAMDWLVPRRVSAQRTQYRAGEKVRFAVSADDAEVLVRLPSAEAAVLSASEVQAGFEQTQQVGMYRYTINDVVRYFAVNLGDDEESDIRRRAVAPQEGVFQAGTAAEAQVIRPLWHYLVLFALLLLAGEWALWRWRRAA